MYECFFYHAINNFDNGYKFRLRELSFTNARELKDRINDLPSGPAWHSKTLLITGFPTNKKINLLYRDSLECAKFLYGNPSFSGCIDQVPHRIFDTQDSSQMYFGGFMSSQRAWDVQVSYYV